MWNNGKLKIISAELSDIKIETSCLTINLAIFFHDRILILDEMDQLESKHQEILYTMFEWPSLPKSKLILIGKCQQASPQRTLIWKRTGQGTRRKHWKEPLKGTKILFTGCGSHFGPRSFLYGSPPRGIITMSQILLFIIVLKLCIHKNNYQ